jgi:hypothetical protein
MVYVINGFLYKPPIIHFHHFYPDDGGSVYLQNPFHFYAASEHKRITEHIHAGLAPSSSIASSYFLRFAFDSTIKPHYRLPLIRHKVSAITFPLCEISAFVCRPSYIATPLQCSVAIGMDQHQRHLNCYTSD